MALKKELKEIEFILEYENAKKELVKNVEKGYLQDILTAPKEFREDL